MICDDLREWIDLLGREGELVEVAAEVDPYLEISEIADRVVKAGGPALLFRNVRGSSLPLLINQFGTERRMCLAFGVERLDELGEKVSSVLEMQPPQGLGDKLRALGKLKSLADSRPEDRLQRALPGDRARPARPRPPADRDLLARRRRARSSRCPRSSRRIRTRAGATSACTGCRSATPISTGLHWQIHKDAAADWREGAGRMEVAVSIGSDPITAYAGSCPAPKHVDELMVAGFLRGKAVEVVQCKTVDLQVPARAEIVLEGYCERGELADEGPFGDHTGYYTPAEPFPVLRLTCMTMRRDAIYPSILVGPPPAEDAWLGKATERLFLPALRATLPELVDYDLPVAGAFHNCCIVSIRKAYPGHARKVMHAVWGTGPALADQDGHRRRRVGRTCTTTARSPGRSARTSTRGATSSRRAGRSTSSITRRRCSRSAASSGSTRRRPGPARATRANGPRSRA